MSSAKNRNRYKAGQGVPDIESVFDTGPEPSRKQKTRERSFEKDEQETNESEKDSEKIVEKEKEPVEIKYEIVTPWQEQEIMEENALLLQAREQSKLDEETNNYCQGFLKTERDNARLDFAKAWFDDKDNKENLRRQGVPVEKIPEDQKARIAIERGAFAQLREREGKYKNDYERIENLNVLIADLQSNQGAHPETPILILNLLQKAAEKLQQEIATMEKEGESPEKIQIKRKERAANFNIRLNLAEKITGHDVLPEMLREAKENEWVMDSRDEYVNRNIDAEKARLHARIQNEIPKFRQEWNKLLPEEQTKNGNLAAFSEKRLSEEQRKLGRKHIYVDQETLLAMMAGGNNPEEIKRTGIFGVFRRRVVIGDQKFTEKEFKDWSKQLEANFQQMIETAMRSKLEAKWNLEADQREERIRQGVEGSIKELSLEQGEEAIKEIAKGLRTRLVAEFTEKELKKDKGMEQLKEAQKEFDRQGVETTQFISDVIERKGLDLTGNLKTDKEKLIGFFDDYGIDMAGLIETKTYDEKTGKDFMRRYEKSCQSRKGLLEFLIDLIFGVPEKKNEGRKGKRQGK